MSSPSDRCCAVDAVQHIVPFGSDPEIHMLTKPATQGKTLLADDHPSVVEDLRAVLQPEFEVIATVGNGCSLITGGNVHARCDRHRHRDVGDAWNYGRGRDPAASLGNTNQETPDGTPVSDLIMPDECRGGRSPKVFGSQN